VLVPRAGLEPARLAAGDFESPESTNFTTWAGFSAKNEILHKKNDFVQSNRHFLLFFPGAVELSG
jgi:hypothetical protein